MPSVTFLVLRNSCYLQFILCSVLFCSLKKATDSKEAESVGSLPLKTNTNTVSQDTRHAIQFPHKHDESVVLHRTADEGMGSSCPATEEHLDKMYLEILKKKTSVNPSLLPQDDKMNQVRCVCLD